VNLFLSRKSNKYYIYLCACVHGCAGAWACAYACACVALLIRYATHMSRVVIVASLSPPNFFDIIS
jgi:hypothetical protein